MKNNLSDLNNHLFEQLERLNDEGVTQEQLEKEITRTDAIVKVSKQLVDTASLQLNAAKLKAEYMGLKADDLPTMLPKGNL